MPSVDRYSWAFPPLGERYGYRRAAGRVSLAPPPTVETVTVVQTVTQTVTTAPATQYLNATPRQTKKANLRYRLKP